MGVTNFDIHKKMRLFFIVVGIANEYGYRRCYGDDHWYTHEPLHEYEHYKMWRRDDGNDGKI
jgi:hypothetical protein